MKKVSFKVLALTLILSSVMCIFLGCNTTTANSKNLKGNIKICLPMAAMKPVYEALAKGYMAKNPGVKVTVEDKEQSAYNDWLGNQIAGGNISADIVQVNGLGQYFSQHKFIDFQNYLNKSNPYMGNQKWKDGMDRAAYGGATSTVYCINPASVQVIWFYNKDIFKQCGLKDAPKDWNEFISDCEVIKKAGFTPLALAGNADSFWAGTAGWLFRIYNDQYWRDVENLGVAKKGDYNFDPEVDGKWQFNPQDKYNDTDGKVNNNQMRIYNLIKQGKIGPDSDKYREMYQNFAKLIPNYVEDGFFGTNDDQTKSLFVNGKAAMYINLVNFAASFDDTMKDAPKKFELGYFWSPAMKSAHIGVNYTRSLGGPNGFFGAINKSKEQNDLNVDFMMYFCSPQGQEVYYKGMEAAKQAPAGPSLIKNVKMPSKWASIFDKMGFNSTCDSNQLAATFARGLNDEQQSVREFQDYTQQYFKGQITVDQLSKLMQKTMVNAIPRRLKADNNRPDALDDDTKDPAISKN